MVTKRESWWFRWIIGNVMLWLVLACTFQSIRPLVLGLALNAMLFLWVRMNRP